MTPKQLNIALEEFHKRKDLQSKESIYQAYLISRWVWQKKIDIDKILQPNKSKNIMTDHQMLEKVRALNKILGGEIKHP